MPLDELAFAALRIAESFHYLPAVPGNRLIRTARSKCYAPLLRPPATVGTRRAPGTPYY